MKQFDVVIIGGGPAAVSCAISAQNTYPGKSLAVIRKEQIALIPCGIPYTLASLNSVEEDILPDSLVTKNGGELIIDEVVDKSDNTLVLKSGEKIVYERLVLATGSEPVAPPIDGVEKEGVFLVYKNYDRLKKMRKYAQGIDTIVIIGGGYIGVEMADEALRAGKTVTVIETLDHLLGASMDREFGEKALQQLTDRGADVLLGETVTSIDGQKNVSGVTLKNGQSLSADMVIISTGSTPNVELAQTFGLETDTRHGIQVNEYLQTSDPDIFAIGDCAVKTDFFTGEVTDVRLASTAMAEGRLAGSNLFTIKVIRQYISVLGSFSTKIGDLAFGVSGITEGRAKELNLDYVVGETTVPDRHPGTLPGATKCHLKLVFSRYSHTLLGAQMVGGNSVGEMVNMFSVMILNRITDMEINTMQIGTHPLLTASPVVYPVITATVEAIKKWYQP